MVCPVCARETVTETGRCTSCGATVFGSSEERTTLRADDAEATRLGPADADVTTLQSDAATVLAPEPITAGRTPPPSDPARRTPGLSGGAGLPEPGEAFGSRYHIIRELGVGGMGAVYQAWDAELGVAVALKLIRPDTDPAVARDIELRFKRELLLARQVTHKNVVRIHDLGELNGIKYITMPYVEGSDLAHMLDAHAKLAVSETLNIAKQVASGLRAAHEVGIVHRDLKPANIMIEGDSALIMDFGIARSVTAPRPGSAPVAAERLPAELKARSGTSAMHSSLTMLGAVVGTIQYMAPEQARAEAVDHRADIYALGLIIYDLLVGRRRQTGYDSAVNELMARTKEPPPPLRTIDPEIPEALDEIVQRCLAVKPEDRYQTTAELVDALDRLDENGNLRPQPKKRVSVKSAVALAVSIPVVITAVLWTLMPKPTPAVQPAPVSLLVADFANRTNDPVFSGLVEQALTVGVEGASFVTTYPRRDALRQTPSGHLDAAAATLVALREGVSRVISGSIEPDSSGYKLTANLIDPSANKVLHSWTEEADSRDAVLQAVGALAGRVRTGLGDTTAKKQPGADESFTAGSLEAARAYENAQELQWSGKAEDAMAEYRRAISLDANLGRAYAGLGALAANLGQRQQAEEYYKQALARIDRMTDRERFRTRGGYYLLTRNADKARDEFQALVDKYPADTAGLANLALADFYKRDMARAVDVGRRASQIYPNNVVRLNNLALFEMYASDFKSAEREARSVLEKNPSREKAFIVLAIAQAAQGQPDQARATYTKLQSVSSNGPSMAADGLADLSLYQGRLADAATVLQAAIKSEKDASRRDRFTVTLAEVRTLQQKTRDAASLARQVLNTSTDPGMMFLASRVLAETGDAAGVHEVSAKLSQRLDTDSQVYANLLDGEVALHQNEARTAIEKFKAAQQITDTWLGRFDLGRAYLLGDAYAEANSEFDTCQKRIGEGTAVLLDDVPTLRLTVPVFYYQARALEGLGSPGAQENYRRFLTIKQGGDEQGLVADARRRVKH
jgi:serine/threonine protein kinase/tetratricopeptide (TPR) repeat protein